MQSSEKATNKLTISPSRHYSVSVMIHSKISHGMGALLSLLLLCSCKEPVDDVITKPPSPPVVAAPANWAARADSAQAALRQGFFTASQYYSKNNAGDASFNYWWQAHGLDVLLDGYKRTNHADYLQQANQLQVGAKDRKSVV